MNIILLEQIFHRLEALDAIYCCILYPALINIKSSKYIYLSSKASNNISQILNYVKYFYNFNFELLLHRQDFLGFKYHNLYNLRLTLDFTDLNLISSLDSNPLFRQILYSPFRNINGIESIEFHIPKYYELNDSKLEIENVNTVLVTSENDIKKIVIKKVKKFILNDGHKLEEFHFDSTLQNLSILRLNNNVLKSIRSENIKELNINTFFNNNDINIKKQFPNLQHLQLDFSNFDSNFDITDIEGDYKTLSLNYIGFGNNLTKSFEDFSNFKNLKTLQLNGNDNITKVNGFKGINLFLDKSRYIQNFNFQNLNTLYLSFNQFITGKDTELFKNIKVLDLSFTNINYLSPNITNLETFIGQECNSLTEFPNYNNLITLNLSSCQNLKKINSLKVKNLYCNNCPKLINLEQISTS
jgi:hypothetical protein